MEFVGGVAEGDEDAEVEQVHAGSGAELLAEPVDGGAGDFLAGRSFAFEDGQAVGADRGDGGFSWGECCGVRCGSSAGDVLEALDDQIAQGGIAAGSENLCTTDKGRRAARWSSS